MLKTGKLDSDLLEKIVFNNIKFRRPEVLTRPGIGEDCEMCIRDRNAIIYDAREARKLEAIFEKDMDCLLYTSRCV